MTITRETIVYDGPGGPFEGMAVYDAVIEGPRPGVLLLPNVLGLKEADFARAEQIAALGYVVFAADLYGQGKRTVLGAPDSARYMNELNADRALLRDRMRVSLDRMKALENVDAVRTAAVGFCFGGKCVLDMARAGLGVLGVVSFHGVYDRPDYANVTPIRAKALVCHGWDDPIAPPEAVVALAAELTEGGADWQLHAYGHAGHAFTDVDRKNTPNPAVAYEPKADVRSFRAMADFLGELFA